MSTPRPPSIAAVLCVSLLLPLLVACGGQRFALRDTPTREMPAAQAVGDLQTDAYGTDGQVEVTPEEDIRRAADIVQRRRPDVDHDPRLDAVASLIANTLAEKKAFPARTLTQWYAWQAGVTGNISALFADYGVGEIPRGEMDRLLKKRVRQLPEEAPQGMKSRFGIARIMVEGVSFQVFLMADEHCRVERFTKQLAAGETVVLKGRCHGEIELPQLFVDTSPTKVDEVDVELDDSGAFTATFAVPDAAGTHYLELTGYLPAREEGSGPSKEERRWRRSLLMVPVYVDSDLPAAPEGVITDPKANPDDVGAWPQLVVDQLNDARVAAGLRPLQLNQRMSLIAKEAVRTDTLDEVGRLIDIHGLMAAQGTPIREGHTIAGVSQYLEEEVWLMLRSPAMRRSLLSKRMTRVGMAFSGPLSGDLYRHRILLAAPVGTLNADRERARFKRSIDRWRKRRGMQALELDEALTAAVTEHVDRICRGDGSLEDTSGLQRRVNALRRPLGALTLRSWRGHYIDPWQPRVVKDLAEIDARWVGIGVCQGTVEGEKNTELVVYLGAAVP